MSLFERPRIEHARQFPQGPEEFKKIIEGEARKSNRLIKIHLSQQPTLSAGTVSIAGLEDIPDNFKKTIQRLVNLSLKYLSRPYVEDNFVHDGERNSWIKQHLEPYGQEVAEFYSKSKLSGNVLNNLALNLETIAGMPELPKQSKLVDYAKQMYAELSPLVQSDPDKPEARWGELPPERKKEISDLFVKMCEEFLNKAGVLGQSVQTQEQRKAA